jgi:hypothetical protein
MTKRSKKKAAPRKQPADGPGAAIVAKRAKAYFDMEPHLCDCVKMGRIASQLFDDPDSELYDFAVDRLAEMLENLRKRYYALDFSR